MKYAALVLVALSACAGADWREPTEAAIVAWNAAHPSAPLSADCEDRVRGMEFSESDADVARECPIGSEGCTYQYDAVGAKAAVVPGSDWRVMAHEAMHVAHRCGSGEFDPHHKDHALWARDPADALHI